MRIGVLLRQVPDPEARLEVDREGTGLVDGSAPWVIDESDEAALDAALGLAKQSDEVVAVVVGPARAEAAARKALALGAARAVRIDGTAAGIDPETPDRAALGELVAAAARHLALDLLLAGAQSSSAGAGLVASTCAAALGWPWVWLAVEVEDDGEGALALVQELEGGRLRRWRAVPPLVLAVQTGRHRARMPTIRGVLAAKRAEVATFDPGALPGAERRPCLRRVSLAPPGAASGVEWIDGADPAAAASQLLRRLREEGAL